jgi:hypothetical protein
MPPTSQTGYPILIHRLDGCMATYAASFEAVRTMLPSPGLHPLRLPDGRAMIGVALAQKRAVTATTATGTVPMPPFAELMVTAIVTRRPLSRAATAAVLGGMVVGLGPVRLGGVPLAVPLTSAVWAEGGRSSMGLPMFVADFELDLSGEPWRFRVSENDQTILALTLRPGGRLGVDRMTQVTYGASGDRLAAARMDTVFVRRRRLQGGAELEIGSGHPVAERLRDLDVSPTAISSWTHLDGRGVIHAPIALGMPASPVPSHPGRDASLGQYRVRLPGAGWVDWYAASAWESAPQQAG